MQLIFLLSLGTILYWKLKVDHLSLYWKSTMLHSWPVNPFYWGLKEPCESELDDLMLILQQVICEQTLCQEQLCRAVIVHWNSSINHPLMLEIIKTVDTYQITLVLHHDPSHYDIKLTNWLDCHCHFYPIIKRCLGLKHLLLGCISEPKLKVSSKH